MNNFCNTCLFVYSRRSLEYEKLQSSLNPHYIFISFLQRLGFDHNELLAFLTSDETCFLLYILQYLKLLLQEWDSFTESHTRLIKAGPGDCDLADLDEKRTETRSTPPAKKMLVSYSSSSSEDEALCISDTLSKSKTVHQDLATLRTFVKLKQSLKKLVDAGEFPYNISPLFSLLQMCENRSVIYQ